MDAVSAFNGAFTAFKSYTVIVLRVIAAQSHKIQFEVLPDLRQRLETEPKQERTRLLKELARAQQGASEMRAHRNHVTIALSEQKKINGQITTSAASGVGKLTSAREKCDQILKEIGVWGTKRTLHDLVQEELLAVSTSQCSTAADL